MLQFILEEQGAVMGSGFRWLNTVGKGRRSTSFGGTFGLGPSKGSIPFLISSRIRNIFCLRNVDGFVECKDGGCPKYQWRLWHIFKNDGLFIFLDDEFESDLNYSVFWCSTIEILQWSSVIAALRNWTTIYLVSRGSYIIDGKHRGVRG